MSGPSAPEAGSAGLASTHIRSGPRPATTRRAVRLTAVLAAVAVVFAVVAAVFHPSDDGGYLEITSPKDSGARAIAQILGNRGVTVTARDSVAVPSAEPSDSDRPSGSGEARAVLVTRPDLLTQSELGDLAREAGDGSDVLLVEPWLAVAALGSRVATTHADPQDDAKADTNVYPGCAFSAATVAGTATIGGSTKFTRVDDAEPVPPSDQAVWLDEAQLDLCYGSPAAARLAVLTPSVLPPASRSTGLPAGRLVLVADGSFLTNERLDESGNAALALGLLARHSRLDWVTPTVAKADSVGSKTISELLPDRFWMVVAQIMVLLVGLALWQGRRLGPPISEPLPVVVRSAETVEGRGRLYAAGQARGRAAKALRTGLRARLADRLGVQVAAPVGPGGGYGGPSDATHEPEPTALIASIAEQTGRPPQEIGSLLYGSDIARTGYPPGRPTGAGWPGPYPRGTADGTGGANGAGDGNDAGNADSDQALVALARELHELDRQVGRR